LKRTRLARRGGRPHADVLTATTACLLIFCLGCPLAPSVPADNGSGTDSGTSSALDTNSNGSLQNATMLPLDSTGQLQFTGAIDHAGDIDVYEIGTLSPGDRVSADVQRLNGNLDAVAAIFDSREYLVAFNDDRTPDGSNLNPLIDIVIRGDQGVYYLAIIGYPGENTYGQYQATVKVQRGVGKPAPQAQTLFLDWAGGRNIDIPNVGTFDLPPFSATDVGFPASQTKQLKQRVQEIVRDRYADYDLIVLNSDDTPQPPDPHSTVYFGGADAQAFAISQQIDTFNKDSTDKAIVFTDGFPGAFSRTPSLEQMAQAIGNTVAHETGHLLGLVHTADCNDMMDTSCTNDRLLSPQEFSTAPIDSSVFPFGMQPETDILSWLIGF
jgi:hypothetical protein